MKLMFLIEHFDPETGKLTRRHLLGNRFFIYHYGVFSFDVMNSYEELVREGKIRDTYPLRLGREVGVRLDEELERAVEGIIEKFGDYTGFDLELATLEMLKIIPFEKDAFFGREVDEILP